MAKHRIVGINFDHMHMGDLLRHVIDHPEAELVGVWHTEPDKPREVLQQLGLPLDLVFDDWRSCIETTQPTTAIICSSTATHGQWTARVAEYDLNILVEKPFAGTLADADAMIQAVAKTGKRLAINWPIAWYPPHRTTKRLIDEGFIGEITNIHYHGGNSGPVGHKMDKIATTGDELRQAKQNSWFYQRAQGGGSLMDYLGYGVTLGTWFNNGKKPIEVTCMVDEPAGLEVDEHAIVIARYDTGLSKFETRWGTFTDPWTHQPQPRCGFVVCGTRGTIACYDYAQQLHVQTDEHPEVFDIPVDTLTTPYTGPIDYFLHQIDHDLPIDGPLSPAICRIGQQIVDTAWQSAQQKKTLPLMQ